MRTNLLLFPLLVIIFLTSCSASPAAATTNDPAVEQAIKTVVNQFAKANEMQDADALERLLHPEFRAIVPRYPDPETMTILPKADYTFLMGSKKIGGNAYQVEIPHITVDEYNATAVCILRGEKQDMHLTLLLTQSADENWQIISDMTRFQPK